MSKATIARRPDRAKPAMPRRDLPEEVIAHALQRHYRVNKDTYRLVQLRDAVHDLRHITSLAWMLKDHAEAIDNIPLIEMLEFIAEQLDGISERVEAIA